MTVPCLLGVRIVFFLSKYILCTCTSVICTPPQILSSNSTGRENITISIVWESASSGRQHSIEHRTPVSSECIIVSVHTVSVDVCCLSVFTDVVVVPCSGSV